MSMESPGPSGSKFDDRNNDNDIENVPDTEVLEALRGLEAIREKTAKELARDDMEGILGPNTQKIEDEIKETEESIKQYEEERLKSTGIPRFVKDRREAMKDEGDFLDLLNKSIKEGTFVIDESIPKEASVSNLTGRSLERDLISHFVSIAKDQLQKRWISWLAEADFDSMEKVRHIELEPVKKSDSIWIKFKVYIVQDSSVIEKLMNYLFKREIQGYARFSFYVNGETGEVEID